MIGIKRVVRTGISLRNILPLWPDFNPPMLHCLHSCNISTCDVRFRGRWSGIILPALLHRIHVYPYIRPGIRNRQLPEDLSLLVRHYHAEWEFVEDDAVESEHLFRSLCR